MNTTQSLLEESDVAKLLKVSVAALRRWRTEQRGPRFIKVGALVLYRPVDIDQWVETRRSGGERTD
jgi:predicted DNA-binding transcriptional regulator AlpA